MTRASAKQLLGNTWLFKQVGDSVALREVALIEAVQNHQSASVFSNYVDPLFTIRCALVEGHCSTNA
jgi:hypothetical protein